MFSLLGTFLPNEMLSIKRKAHRVLGLKLNEDPVREMTIRHVPKCEVMDPSTCWLT